MRLENRNLEILGAYKALLEAQEAEKQAIEAAKHSGTQVVKQPSKKVENELANDGTFRPMPATEEIRGGKRTRVVNIFEEATPENEAKWNATTPQQVSNAHDRFEGVFKVEVTGFRGSR